MTSPFHAIATERGRLYGVPGFKEQFPSVTNFLGIIAAPAIINAAARRAAECAVNDEATWKAVQQEQGDAAAIGYIKEAANRYMNERGELGTAVHDACEHEANGVATDDPTYPYVLAYRRWLERDKPEIIAQECTVFSPEYGYAGTADLICRIDGKTYVGDLKSGYVASKAALQMVAYARATYVVRGKKSVPVPWTIDGAFVLDLKPGKFGVKYCDIGDESWRAFRAAMILWEFEGRKDVFGRRWL